MSPEELQARYARSVIDALRTTIALYRAHPGCYVRWRRAATVGPNADKVVLFIYEPGRGHRTEMMLRLLFEAKRALVTEEEAFAVMAERASRFGHAFDEASPEA